MTKSETLADIDRQIAETKAQLADVHGSECEVYARIVGYYRSVKNWNKGKQDEYKIRSMFDEPSAERMASEIPQEHCDSCAVQQVVKQNKVNSNKCKVQSKDTNHLPLITYHLYYRTTCPNCPPVKARMQYITGGEMINVDTNEGLAQAVKEGVFTAPTVIFYADGKETARAHNVGEIDEILGTQIQQAAYKEAA